MRHAEGEGAHKSSSCSRRKVSLSTTSVGSGIGGLPRAVPEGAVAVHPLEELLPVGEGRAPLACARLLLCVGRVRPVRRGHRHPHFLQKGEVPRPLLFPNLSPCEVLVFRPPHILQSPGMQQVHFGPLENRQNRIRVALFITMQIRDLVDYVQIRGLFHSTP